MAKRSKRMKSALSQVDSETRYTLDEAIERLAQFPKAKFDETVELYANLGVDPKQSSQMVRGTVSLPNGSGKKISVVVFTDNPDEAKAAGADHAGMDDMIAKVLDGWMDFDVAIATTAAMKEVRKVARVLGPRGLMPNPKSGTVTDDVASAIKEVKAGRVEYKMDKTANLAVIVGKRSFSKEQLLENTQTVIDSLSKAKPDTFKGGAFIKSLTLSGTMTPGVKLETKTVISN